MNRRSITFGALVLAITAAAAACNGSDGAAGPAGPAGGVGAAGAVGPAGPAGPVGSADAAADVAAPAMPATSLALPGPSFYPESLAAAASGALFVGSLAQGEIVKFDPGSAASHVLVAPLGAGVGVTGLLVDEATSSLLACTFDVTGKTTAPLRRFSLASGAQLAAYPFPEAAICNDLAFDGDGDLFVTDSLGKIYELARGASALTAWSSAPELAPSKAGGFGADGIVVIGKDVFVNTFSDSRFVRIPIRADGTAGALVPITVTPKLESPDGMRVIGSKLVVAEGVGRLTELTVSGDAAKGEVIANGLDAPTSFVSAGGTFWITEGQLPHFLGQVSTPPNLPFEVRRLPPL